MAALQCLSQGRPPHPVAAKEAARRWSVLAPAVALISRDFIWCVPSGLAGATVGLLVGEGGFVGDTLTDHGRKGRELYVQSSVNDTTLGGHSGGLHTTDFNFSETSRQEVEQTYPVVLSSSLALSVAAAGAKIVSGVDDVIWLSPFVTKPSTQQRMRNAATYFCLFFGFTLFSAALAWTTSLLWSKLPSDLVIHGWTMEEFLEVASGALLLVYALNLFRGGRGTCGGLASPDSRRVPPSTEQSAVGTLAPTPRQQGEDPAAVTGLSPVAPPAGLASVDSAASAANATSAREMAAHDDQALVDEVAGTLHISVNLDNRVVGDGIDDGGGLAGASGEDLEAADIAPAARGVPEDCRKRSVFDVGRCSSCFMVGCCLCVFASCGGRPRSDAVSDDPSQWTSPIPGPATAVPSLVAIARAVSPEVSTVQSARPAVIEQRQGLSARHLVVVALVGGLDDICVQTLLLLAGSFELSHMLLGDLIGCSVLLAISCGSGFAHWARRVVDRVPLYPMVVGVLATYTIIYGLIV